MKREERNCRGRGKYAQSRPVERLSREVGGSQSQVSFAEATFDTVRGTGLDVTGTKGTDPSKWPGDNKLGLIVKKAAAAKCG